MVFLHYIQVCKFEVLVQLHWVRFLERVGATFSEKSVFLE